MKPILFSGPMVRAILDGQKSQTRRVIKPQPYEDEFDGPNIYTQCAHDRHGDLIEGDEAYGISSWDGEWAINSRYQPGDILWVRETWYRVDNCKYCMCDDEPEDQSGCYLYRATHDADLLPWRPSISMPLKAARIFLRVTGVRAERLQEMPLVDVWSEGTPQMPGNNDSDGAVNQQDFKYLWDSINAKRADGAYAWDRNPWVWVYSFGRISKEAAHAPQHTP